MMVVQLLLWPENQVNFRIAALMTPYQLNLKVKIQSFFISALFVLGVAGRLALAGDVSKSRVFETFTQSGLEHYYSLEYDEALRDFEKAMEAHQDDAQAYNHILEAVLFRELYKHDALDTSLYTQKSFLNGKQIVLEPAVKQQIKDLTETALSLCEKRLKSNPRDAEALYARGVTRGLRSTYLGLVEKSWFSALRNAVDSRSDHEAVLKEKPDYVDAKTVVGIHNYIVATLPLRTKILASLVGVTGDKKKGLEYLDEAGKAGGESNVDARIALALFLRREQRYDEAFRVVQSLTEDHPRNFLFALERANVMKDGGKGSAAIGVYRVLLKDCQAGKYPDPHTELAQFGLGEALRGQNHYQEAVQAYEAAGNTSSDNHDLRQRALLAAGEVSDLLTWRQQAVRDYRAALALDSSSTEADAARGYLDKPYQGK
jgi:tetratricopeptide (TPR) repeat protein